MHSLDYCETFINAVRSFDTGMVAICGVEGHARPMFVVDVRHDGHVVFLSTLETVSLIESEDALKCTVTFQGANRFVSAVGRLTIDRSRPEIGRIWSEMWRTWFPRGPSDPSLCLVRLAIDEGHYWDATDSHGRNFVFERRTAKCVTPPPRPIAARESWA